MQHRGLSFRKCELIPTVIEVSILLVLTVHSFKLKHISIHISIHHFQDFRFQIKNVF
jgi:hypothetical protein